MINYPDKTVRGYHCRDVDAIRNVPELVLEFISRRDFIAIYLVAVGFWCGWLGVKGLQLDSTKGFGWRAPDLIGEEASAAGRVWLAIAAGLLAVGVGFWISS